MKKIRIFIFLSSEPFPFKKKHCQELSIIGFLPRRIQLIDGEMCSWHGTRMLQAFSYFEKNG